jgi:hypothetical protein
MASITDEIHSVGNFLLLIGKKKEVVVCITDKSVTVFFCEVTSAMVSLACGQWTERIIAFRTMLTIGTSITRPSMKLKSLALRFSLDVENN